MPQQPREDIMSGTTTVAPPPLDTQEEDRETNGNRIPLPTKSLNISQEGTRLLEFPRFPTELK